MPGKGDEQGADTVAECKTTRPKVGRVGVLALRIH